MRRRHLFLAEQMFREDPDRLPQEDAYQEHWRYRFACINSLVSIGQRLANKILKRRRLVELTVRFREQLGEEIVFPQ